MNDEPPIEPRPSPPVEMGLTRPPTDMLPPPEPAYGIPIVDLNGGPVVRRPGMLLAMLVLLFATLLFVALWWLI